MIEDEQSSRWHTREDSQRTNDSTRYEVSMKWSLLYLVLVKNIDKYPRLFYTYCHHTRLLRTRDAILLAKYDPSFAATEEC